MKTREIAAAIVIDQDRNFLLQQRDDIPNIICPGMIGLFGGHRENEEAYLDCVVRELCEELSYDIDASMLSPLTIYKGIDLEVDGGTVEAHLYVVNGLRAGDLTVTEGAMFSMTAEQVRGRMGDLTPLARIALEAYFASDGHRADE